jgi:hypothetical protein
MRRRPRRRVPLGARWDLHYGPFGVTDEGESVWTVKEGVVPPAFKNDSEAARAFRALEPAVDEDDWAYWRFVRGLGPRRALAAVWAVRKRQTAVHHRQLATKIGMPDWEYVQRMLAKADELEREADEFDRAASVSAEPTL